MSRCRDTSQKQVTVPSFLSNGELARRISEELRTPLFAVKDIISNAAQGRLGDMNPRLQDSLRVADSKLQRLTKALNDLLPGSGNGPLP